MQRSRVTSVRFPDLLGNFGEAVISHSLDIWQDSRTIQSIALAFKASDSLLVAPEVRRRSCQRRHLSYALPRRFSYRFPF